jgi:4-amino-4-deoxy-L-arabinose transferase-like glycosyltransferase
MSPFNRFFRSRYFWLLFAGLAVFVYFFGLTVPLLGPDEPRYAQVAREMFERGDWVTPTLGGHHWFEKPALLYWLQIGSYTVFGVNEFAARFGSAVFGLGTIASLWLIGRIGGGRTSAANGDTTNESLANYIALIAASTLGLIVFSRGASFDIILTFPITASLVGFFAYDRAADEARRQKYIGLAAFYFFIGVGLLAKGLIGAVFPVAIVAFYHLLCRRLPGRMLLLSGIWGAFLTAVVTSAWYLPMYVCHGWQFIDEFFLQHHFQRYTSNKYLHPQPFYFFFWVLPLMTIPWLPFFAMGLWRAVRVVADRIKRADAADKGEASLPGSLAIFAFAWMTVPLVFFSFSGSKLPGYILPSVPAAIIITAAYVLQFVRKSESRRSAIKLLALATLVVIAVIAQSALPSFADSDSVKRLIAEADALGYSEIKVVGLFTISHNAEFYAAGRLLREPDGKQFRLLGTHEIGPTTDRTGEPVLLILVRPEQQHHLDELKDLKYERIADNGELAIVAVTRQ